MEKNRLSLHQELLKIVPNVYYQPPENLKIQIPCIIYNLDGLPVKPADNKKYMNNIRYQILCLDKDPESIIPEKVLELPMTSFSRQYSDKNVWYTSITLFL